jgi:hypothetical protein
MIDFESFRQSFPTILSLGYLPMGGIEFTEDFTDCHCDICSENQALRNNQKYSYDLDVAKRAEEFAELTQYMICPPRVLGFCLSKRLWVELKVSGVKNIEKRIRTEAFSSLIMQNEKYKHLIKNLVTSHWSKTKGSESPYMEDFMKGKGEGLVILLYGNYPFLNYFAMINYPKVHPG